MEGYRTASSRPQGCVPAVHRGALGGFVGGSVALLREERGRVSPGEGGEGGEVLVQYRDPP